MKNTKKQSIKVQKILDTITKNKAMLIVELPKDVAIEYIIKNTISSLDKLIDTANNWVKQNSGKKDDKIKKLSNHKDHPTSSHEPEFLHESNNAINTNSTITYDKISKPKGREVGTPLGVPGPLSKPSKAKDEIKDSVYKRNSEIPQLIKELADEKVNVVTFMFDEKQNEEFYDFLLVLILVYYHQVLLLMYLNLITEVVYYQKP
jgi:hypothetical protein